MSSSKHRKEKLESLPSESPDIPRVIALNRDLSGVEEVDDVVGKLTELSIESGFVNPKDSSFKWQIPVESYNPKPVKKKECETQYEKTKEQIRILK